jgi:hypothetical protein
MANFFQYWLAFLSCNAENSLLVRHTVSLKFHADNFPRERVLDDPNLLEDFPAYIFRFMPRYGLFSGSWKTFFPLHPQTPKHVYSGGWSHYTDTGKPVVDYVANNMVIVQFSPRYRFFCGSLKKILLYVHRH